MYGDEGLIEDRHRDGDGYGYGTTKKYTCPKCGATFWNVWEYKNHVRTCTGGGGGGGGDDDKKIYPDYEPPTAPPYLWNWIQGLYGQGYDPQWMNMAEQRLKEGIGSQRRLEEQRARENLAYRNVYGPGLVGRAYQQAETRASTAYGAGMRDIMQRHLEQQKADQLAAIQAATRLFGIEGGYGMDWMWWLLQQIQTQFNVNAGAASY